MCGRFTQKYTWEEFSPPYRLTQPARNIRPQYHICPTDPIDVIIPGIAGLAAPMRWQLIPSWWKNSPSGAEVSLGQQKSALPPARKSVLSRSRRGRGRNEDFLEWIPSRLRRELKVAEVGAKPQSHARTNWNYHHLIRG